MSITETMRLANDADKLAPQEQFMRRPYARPVLHRDQLLGPILCASQGQGHQPDACTPCLPPGAPWCQ